MHPSTIKNINLLPNIITAFGLSCGLFAIFKMNMTEVGEVNFSILWSTASLLILAALADLLDGAVARAMKAESEFGGIFDSLADAISFGVAPSVIILKSMSITPSTKLSFVLTTAAIMYSLCGVLRLVRFNVHASRAKGNVELTLANKKNFTGLPIPGAAAAAVSLNLFLFSPPFQQAINLSTQTQVWISSISLVLLSYCMISRWKFPSFKSLKIRIHSFASVLLTVISAMLILYGILYYFSLLFVIIAWGYIFITGVLALVRLWAGKKSKTLEDFEPEPDELDETDL